MARYVFTDASWTYNGQDLSNHVESIVLNLSQPAIGLEAMGDSGHVIAPGLPDCSIDVTYRQDYAASNVDATNYGAWSGGTAGAFILKPTSAATSSTNPKFTGNAYVQDFKPISGTIGDAADATVTYVVNGAVTRGIV